MGLALGVAAVALLAGSDAWACGGGRPPSNAWGNGYGPSSWMQRGPTGAAPWQQQAWRPTAYAPGNPYAQAPMRPAPVPMMVASGPRPQAAPYPMPYQAPYGYQRPQPYFAQPYPAMPQPMPYRQPQMPQQFTGWPGPSGFGTQPMLAYGSQAVTRNLPPAAMAVPQGAPYGYGYPAPMPYYPGPGYNPYAGPAYWGPTPGWGYPRW